MRQKVVVERVLLRDRVPANGVAVVGPIGEVRPYFALAWTVVEVGVLDCLGAAHLIDADVAIRSWAMGEGEVKPHRTK